MRGSDANAVLYWLARMIEAGEDPLYVDDVFLSIDKDKTVCTSLRKIKPDIFAKGGDRTKKNML